MDRNQFKKAEALLYSYNEINLNIECIKIEIKRYEEDYKGCGAIGYSENTSSSNAFKSSVENEVLERERELSKLKRELRDKEDIKAKIDNVIIRLSDQEKKLVELRYTNRNTLSWEEVANILRFSPSYCRQKLRKKVVDKFAKTIFATNTKQIKIAI